MKIRFSERIAIGSLPRWFAPGEVADLEPFIAEPLLRRGVAVLVEEAPEPEPEPEPEPPKKRKSKSNQ